MFWSPVSLAIGLVVTWLAIVRQDLRWLLLLAGPLFTLSAWWALRILEPRRAVLLMTAGVALIVAGGLDWLSYANRQEVADEVARKGIAKGIRLVGLEFGTAAIGQPVEVVGIWENESDLNLTVRDKYTLSTLGLDEKEVGIISLDTARLLEQNVWTRLEHVGYSPAQEIEPHAKFIMRYKTDPKAPLDDHLVNALRNDRARVYLAVKATWSVEGKEHGCDFCGWTDGTGRSMRCRTHNRLW